MTGSEVSKWADSAMFHSEKHEAAGPRVYLLSMTSDPLGAVAACAKMYKGEVVRSLAEVTDDERRYYLNEMRKTKLKMPLEAVQLHFMLDGVTRAFTHQLVRQRTAAYAQESMRFAVVEDLEQAVALPPSIGALAPDDPKRRIWENTVLRIEDGYTNLVNAGIPAEDARGLLPTNVTTRVHYITNLRGLLDHAGNRLCTQAQFEWRVVFAEIASAIRSYHHMSHIIDEFNAVDYEDAASYLDSHYDDCYGWQQDAIADLLRPVCYQTGSCAFHADFDRKCKIRNRVDANADIGRSSDEWHLELDRVEGNPIVSGVGPQSVVRDERGQPVFIGAIDVLEWLADPGAAR